MAVKRVIELTKKIQDFSKKVKFIGDIDIYGYFVTKLIQTIKARLEDGMESGINIDGRPFRKADPRPTNPVTIKLRDSKFKQGQSSQNPILHGEGKLAKSFRLHHRGEFGNATIILDKDDKYNQYGKHHNSGFKTGSTSIVPNATVPARKYWGIPKTWQSPNGTAYKKALAAFASDLKFNFYTYYSTTGKSGDPIKYNPKQVDNFVNEHIKGKVWKREGD